MAHTLDDATYNAQVKAVWAATMWLAILTVIEVGFALLYEFIPALHDGIPRWLLNLTFIIATLGKGFFIVAEFMHLKYEKRVLMISLAVPMIFLVWAIIAFMWEADSWFHLRGF